MQQRRMRPGPGRRSSESAWRRLGSERRARTREPEMELLTAYVLGAVSAAVLIFLVLRWRGSGDPAVHESLGEFRELLEGVRTQQGQLATQATQWNQLLGRSGDRGRCGEMTLQNLVE